MSSRGKPRESTSSVSPVKLQQETNEMLVRKQEILERNMEEMKASQEEEL